MKPVVRPYRQATDYERIGAFLVRTYRTEAAHVNWLQPRWEYMHFHPLIRDVDLDRIGVWEAGGEIAAVAHPEHRNGRVYVEIDPEHDDLRADMLDYAEAHLAVAAGARRELGVWIHDADARLRRLATDRGFEPADLTEEMSYLPITDALPAPSLPAGFRLQTLADDNDLWKVHEVLWRGFDHGDDPPEDEFDDRRFMQSAPNFRRDLNVVVVTPDGEFASYCGMWLEPLHRVAYVEPVATDPRYRRMGLASAAVLEGIRRCGQLGAEVAYVGSVYPVYLSLGFQQTYTCTLWQRRWTRRA